VWRGLLLLLLGWGLVLLLLQVCIAALAAVC
jgi:hypothetical protein